MARTVYTSSGTFVCTSVWTNEAPEQPQEDEYRRLLTIILGSIFAGTLLVVAVAVVVVLLRRYCARRKRKSSTSSNSAYASAWTTTSRPQVGYSSKRFAKGGATEKPRTSVATVSGNGREQTTSEAFTPEERAKILVMLAGYSPRAFSNAAYDAGSSEFAADSNGHVYDAIPGDEYYDVPLDSAV